MTWPTVRGPLAREKSPGRYQLTSYKITGRKDGQTVTLYRFGPGPALAAKQRLESLGWSAQITSEENKT